MLQSTTEENPPPSDTTIVIGDLLGKQEPEEDGSSGEQIVQVGMGEEGLEGQRKHNQSNLKHPVDRFRGNKISIKKSNILPSDESSSEEKIKLENKLIGLEEAQELMINSPQKEFMEDYSPPALYTPKQIELHRFNYTKDTLFSDTFFNLPINTKNMDQYVSQNFSHAFIHSLNLASCSIVYTSVGQFIKLYSQRRKTNLKKCWGMYRMEASLSNQAANTDQLRYNCISKVLFNARTGIWYNSKQQIVWDCEYFRRQCNEGRALEIPQNLLGIDTIPVIYGVGMKAIKKKETISSVASGPAKKEKKVQFEETKKSTKKR